MINQSGQAKPSAYTRAPGAIWTWPIHPTFQATHKSWRCRVPLAAKRLVSGR